MSQDTIKYNEPYKCSVALEILSMPNCEIIIGIDSIVYTGFVEEYENSILRVSHNKGIAVYNPTSELIDTTIKKLKATQPNDELKFLAFLYKNNFMHDYHKHIKNNEAMLFAYILGGADE